MVHIGVDTKAAELSVAQAEASEFEKVTVRSMPLHF